ncbi:hypothetical protein [Kangiella shandongensis]|uniref:hypothetical protein n=1 Tax=Kangiella shandongensis TaxID=2763258 RepID=UPI001CBCBC75|nr:hypothetical protein [Kangiella shandongensis]
MTQARCLLVTLCSVLALSACSSTNGNGFLKTMSRLLGGQPDKTVFMETSVKEELQYEYRLCLDDYEGNEEDMSRCMRQAYARIAEEKGIGERPEGGEVIIEEVNEDDVIDEDKEEPENNN